MTEARISPRYMLLLILSVPAVACIYYLIGTRFFGSPLGLEEYIVVTTLIAVALTGGYQLFFWVQRNNFRFRARCFVTALDRYIPFWPSWVWVYSFLYYAAIGFVVASIQSISEGVYLMFGCVLLLLAQMSFFYLLPSTVPPEYRDYEANTLSKKYLRFVQGKDNGRNCMPSMHCSVAMYVGLILYPVIAIYSWIFVSLIAISCLFVKQHQVADIVPGFGLGWAIWYLAPTI